MKRRLILLAALAFVATSTTACQPAVPDNARVLIFGDSLTSESRGSGEAHFWMRRWRTDWSTVRFMGTPCVGRRALSGVTYRPDVVVIHYSGINRATMGTPCAYDGSKSLAAHYRDDYQRIIDHFRNGHTRIVVVAGPSTSDADAQAIRTMGKNLAEAPHNQIAWFDGGRNIPNARTAPCLPEALENPGPRCGQNGAGPGRNIIREASLRHLCPTGTTISGSCDRYNSGAVRQTRNLVDAVNASKTARR